MNNVQNRSFLGALSASIIAFCKTFIRGMTVLEDGVAMAELSVKSARRKLVVDLKLSESNYVSKAVSRAALEQARQQKTLKEFASGSEEDAKNLQENLNRLTNVVNKELADLEVKEEE